MTGLSILNLVESNCQYPQFMHRQQRFMLRIASLHDVIWLEPRFKLLCAGSLLIRADLASLPVSPIWHTC